METKTQSLTVSEKLNQSVAKVIGAEKLQGFERAYLIAQATADLKQLLTAEYMKPIMALQGSSLGFKTDKDKEGGYPESVVKDCLIEAVLKGLQPYGNEFNIIAGNQYTTKEGFGSLLKKVSGLKQEIINGLPRINTDNTSAAIDMTIKWSYNGEIKEQVLPIPVKMNRFMGTDAVIGKATRKARAWLHATVTGVELGDGDASENDAKATVITPHVVIDKEEERILLMIQDCKTTPELEKIKIQIKTDSCWASYDDKKLQLSSNGK